MSFKFQILIPAFFALFLSITFSEVTLAGFTYRKSCAQVLNGKRDAIEVVKKVLAGERWPEGTKDNFSLMEFNVLNMIDHADALKMDDGAKQIARGYGPYAKSKAQLDGISRIFSKYRAAIAFCVEISSVHLLRSYDHEFLGNQYEEFLIEGNDPRGVDVGLLVRKDLPLEVEMHSHKNMVDSETGELVFSRDLPAYILREKGQQKPLMIIFGTHFKSQRSTDNDKNGFRKRSLQAKAASVIVGKYEEMFPEVPILLVGDFNNDVRRAPEFTSLKNIGLVDSFDVAADTVPEAERGTHFFFPRNGNPSVSQLDAIMLNKTAVKKQIAKSTKVLSHIDSDGQPYPPPRSYEERQRRPSDHLPILSVFDLSR